MDHRTQKELSEALKDLRTTGRSPSNAEHAEDMRRLIGEVEAHPLWIFARKNDAAILARGTSIGNNEAPTAEVIAGLMARYIDSLSASTRFQNVYETLHVAINLKMDAASDYEVWLTRMQEAGLLGEEAREE